MMSNTVRRSLAPVLLSPLILLGLVACGDADDDVGDDADASAHHVAEGHDGDTGGNELAAGANTPQDPEGRYYLHQGDRGPDVEQLQGRLVELGAPVDAVDGIFGDETLHAVLQFQAAEGLAADGVVGTATWASLDDPQVEPDWATLELPAEYASSEPTQTDATTPAPGTATAGDGASPEPLSAPEQDPASGGDWARAVVSISAEVATFYDADGNVVLSAPISAGHDGLTPLGTFQVQSKSERAFAGNGVYMDHMTRFNGGIGFHSIPKRADGSDIPTPLGERPVSHGCIRMADQNAQIVFENLPIGATVEVVA